MATRRSRVVVLGGGFAGLHAAKALRNAPVELTVVDRRNHHLSQPLLYHVATAGLSAIDIGAPIRQILRCQGHTQVLTAEAEAIDVESRRVVLFEWAKSNFTYQKSARLILDRCPGPGPTRRRAD